MIPGIRYFWDFDGKVSAIYGAMESEGALNGPVTYNSFTFVLDPSLRVLAKISLADEEKHNQIIAKILAELPPINNLLVYPFTLQF